MPNKSKLSLYLLLSCLTFANEQAREREREREDLKLNYNLKNSFLLAQNLEQNSSLNSSKAHRLEATNVTATLSDAQKAGAITSKEGVNTSTQSLDNIIRSIPGSYTQVDQSQGTVSINIQGTTGLGRVNTMVDGVAQTFYGTSAMAGNGTNQHGSGDTGTSAFGALIDQNFIVGIDMQRGTFNANTGSNALMGSANLRTIGADDIILDGKPFGILAKYSYGSNAIGPSYMGAVAGKAYNDNNGFMSAMYAYSGKKISQDYKTGGGIKISEDNQNFQAIPLATQQLSQKPSSHLLKFEVSPDNVNFINTSYRRYDTYLSGRDINADSYQISYRLNPQSHFVDTKLLMAYNETRQEFDDSFTWISGGGPDYNLGRDFKKVASHNKYLTLDLSNTSVFNINEKSNLSINFGANYSKNKYERIFIRKQDTPNLGGYGIDMQAAISFLPAGEQELSSAYLNNTFIYDIFSFDANLNLTHAKLGGNVGLCNSRQFCGDYYDRDRNNYKIKRLEKKDTNFNYSLMLALEFHELFTPFASYAKTSRMINVQEQFFSGGGTPNVNVFLKPETAKTYQAGFNSFSRSLLFDDDHFGFKALYYRTKISDYIYNGGLGLGISFSPYINGEAEFKGIEAELNYDVRVFYSKLSYSHQKASYPLYLLQVWAMDRLSFQNFHKIMRP
ncbi:TonB-dependent receptor domain-containing protein [Campylobacter sp. MIT 99-7217]|uniref:TonB-dependent receptor domain-containing protein n=1 Tax=Campylobacter sp. MIT 99-7217 TaxID=535091 RepID=UPI00115997D6|nr:TonB-dependent receptor [Campylobacter sp. MIT 99-7217]